MGDMGGLFSVFTNPRARTREHLTVHPWDFQAIEPPTDISPCAYLFVYLHMIHQRKYDMDAMGTDIWLKSKAFGVTH